MSTKAACMPGRTLVTSPLWTLPTMERRPSRSTYSSVMSAPSCTATRVSVSPALTTIRLPTAAPRWRARRRPPARPPCASLELPHPDREQEPERRQGDDHRGAAVTHERQRDPHHGQEARDHPHVDQHLGGDEPGGAERHQASHRLARARRDVEAPEQEQDIAHEQHETADEPPHLGEYGEDEIRVALRHEGQPALRGAGDPLAQELP